MKQMSPLEWIASFIAVCLVMTLMVALDWSEKFAEATVRQLKLAKGAAVYLAMLFAGTIVYFGALWVSPLNRCRGKWRCRQCARCYVASYLYTPRHC